MLIDDNESNLFPLKIMLSELYSINSTSFLFPMEAVEAFKRRLQRKCCSRVYKLVLTDISMPQMDGYQVGRMIKAYQDFWLGGFKKTCTLLSTKTKSKCPVVAVTAYTHSSVYQIAS